MHRAAGLQTTFFSHHGRVFAAARRSCGQQSHPCRQLRFHRGLTAPPQVALMDFSPADSLPRDAGAQKLRVAVDVDEGISVLHPWTTKMCFPVLGQFLVSLNRFCEVKYGMYHDIDDYHVYNFAAVWGCSQETSNHIVHEFFKSAYFHRLPLVPGAFETLCEMQKWCELHVVTSRQFVIQDITMKWLRDHYPGIFTSVHFGNHFSLHGDQKPKSELCKAINADVLIDDNPDYALDCALSGMHVVLYNWRKGYPWSSIQEKYAMYVALDVLNFCA